jgi:uncharacterized caspase-like protein
VALVIGNGAYQNAPKLPNPAADARAVAEALRGLDFEVIEAVDLDQPDMLARCCTARATRSWPHPC